MLGALGIARAFDGVFAIEDMTMFGELRPKPDARMLKRLAVRLRVPPSRCVLVEDTLVHQRLRRIGMQTVWMQRWMRRAAAVQRKTGAPCDAAGIRRPARAQSRRPAALRPDRGRPYGRPRAYRRASACQRGLQARTEGVLHA